MTMNQDNIDPQARENEQNRLRERQASKARQRDEDLKAVMLTEAGRRVMADLLATSGLYRTSFAGEDARTNFNEGMRNIGIIYHARINEVCPELYLKMLKELDDERQRDRATDRTAD